MRMNKTLSIAGASVLTGAALIAAGAAALAGNTHAISQKGRAFQPKEIAIARGDSLNIVNDDGELLHHAFLRSPDLSFDSGEQNPGQSITIAFAKAGAYEVLCGIHPKMRLTVTVK